MRPSSFSRRTQALEHGQVHRCVFGENGSCNDRRLIGDRPQVERRPRRVRRAVDSCQPPDDRFELGGTGHSLAKRDARVVPVAVELDAQERAFSRDDARSSAMLIPVRWTSSAVMSPSSMTVTRSRRSTPTAVSSVEPSAGAARRQRLNASVTRPAAIPSRRSCGTAWPTRSPNSAVQPRHDATPRQMPRYRIVPGFPPRAPVSARWP